MRQKVGVVDKYKFKNISKKKNIQKDFVQVFHETLLSKKYLLQAIFMEKYLIL